MTSSKATMDFTCLIDVTAWSKVLWDRVPVARLPDPLAVPSEIVRSPVVSDQPTWSEDRTRHFVRSATFVRRDDVLRDFFFGLERV